MGLRLAFTKFIYIYIYRERERERESSKTFIVFGFKCFLAFSDNVTKHFMVEKFTKG